MGFGFNTSSSRLSTFYKQTSHLSDQEGDTQLFHFYSGGLDMRIVRVQQWNQKNRSL